MIHQLRFLPEKETIARNTLQSVDCTLVVRQIGLGQSARVYGF